MEMFRFPWWKDVTGFTERFELRSGQGPGVEFSFVLGFCSTNLCCRKLSAAGRDCFFNRRF